MWYATSRWLLFPIKLFSYDLVHLEQMLYRSAVTAQKFKDAFSNFQRNRTSTRAKWRYELSTQVQGKDTEQELEFPIELCSTLMRSTHRCLQCPYICTIEEMNVHSAVKGHIFCKFPYTSETTQRVKVFDQMRVSDQDRYSALNALIIFMIRSLNKSATR